MAQEKSAGAVIYRITEDGNILYLLLQPAPGKPWGFPKGKIDRGESETEAAKREITEEAGLEAIAFDPDFREVVHYVYRRGRSLIRKDVVYFLACVTQTSVRISWEHVAYRWATPEESLELVVFENTRELLHKAQDHLIRHLGISPAD